MVDIKITDCTLRDGGYVNDWNFGGENIYNIISLINQAKIDFIEIGFITNTPARKGQTLFNSFYDFEKYIPPDIDTNKLLAMIAYGTFPIEKIPEAAKTKLGGIRLIFKKNQKENALLYARKLKEKGYRLFINPTFAGQYSNDEFLKIIKEVNLIQPYSFSITDSTGCLREKELGEICKLVNDNLDEKISLCFHTHNNLRLSFQNAKFVIENGRKGELVIDSTVFGMGRGAGNLCSEFLIRYVNQNYNGKYDIMPILKIANEIIKPIFEKTPWGYSVPYYLAASNGCHPNYAKFLIDKKVTEPQKINRLFQIIPAEKKAVFDLNLIKNLLLKEEKELFL